MTGFVILTVLVLLALAAPRYGVDTRWGPGQAPRHTVLGDLRAASGRIRRPVRTPR